MTKFPDITLFWRAIVTLRNNDKVRSATAYDGPKLRVTASRAFKPDRRNTRETISVTWGTPNYAGREFVKACKKAGEPFPVKKVQLRWWPKKRKPKK